MRKYTWLRRMMAFVIILTLLLTTAPAVTLAEEYNDAGDVILLGSGTCGEHLTWKLDTKHELWIEGTGEMDNYSGPGTNDAPWSKFAASIKSVVIGEGVTSVGDHAFYHYPKLAHLHLSSTITTIGNAAFYRCSQLSAPLFPYGLTSIGQRAFFGTYVKKIELPTTVTFIGEGAFAECYALQTVELPASIGTIQSSTFANCDGLQEIILPANLRFIGNSAFDGCKNLLRVLYRGSSSQWYHIGIAAGNDYLDDARLSFDYIPESELIDASNISLKVFTSVPFTALRAGETMAFRVALERDGLPLVPGDDVKLTAPSVNIVDYEFLPDAWQFTVKGNRNRTIFVPIRMPGTTLSETIEFFTQNRTDMSRCGSYQPSASSSCITLADYTCLESNGTHTISFTARNTGYSCGAAIVYDESGDLLQCVPILSKRNSGTDYMRGGARYIAMNSEPACTEVVLRDLPQNAEIIITADGDASPYPTLFTGIDLYIRAILAAAHPDCPENVQPAVSLALMELALEKLTPTQITNCAELLRPELNSHSASPELAPICNISSIINSLYKDVSVDLSAELTHLLTQADFPKLTLPSSPVITSAELPLWESNRTPESIWSVVWPMEDYRYNQNRGSTRLFTAGHAETHTLTNSTVSVTDPLGFTDGTVLDAAPPASAANLSLNLTSGLQDCTVYSFRLLRDGVDYVPANTFELPRRTLTVRLPLPTESAGRWHVYRVEEDGTRTYIPARTENGKIVFKTDRTGTFITGLQSENENPTPAVLLGIAVFAAGLALCLILRRKRTARLKN